MLRRSTPTDGETLSAELARLRAEGTFNEGIEAGAAFIEANAVLHGDTIEFRPRTEGDRNGLAYAEGIRSLRRPETGGAVGSGFAVDGWGAGPFIIVVKAKRYRFEDSDRFGPYIVGRRGQILDEQPSEHDPFWRAHFLWRKQGRIVERGVCVWREPKPTIYRRSGRKIVVVEQGEPDGLELLGRRKLAPWGKWPAADIAAALTTLAQEADHDAPQG